MSGSSWAFSSLAAHIMFGHMACIVCTHDSMFTWTKGFTGVGGWSVYVCQFIFIPQDGSSVAISLGLMVPICSDFQFTLYVFISVMCLLVEFYWNCLFISCYSSWLYYFPLLLFIVIVLCCHSVSFKAFYQLHQSVCFSLHVFFFPFWLCRQEGLVQWGLLALRGRSRKEGKKQTKTFLRYCKTTTLRIVSKRGWYYIILIYRFVSIISVVEDELSLGFGHIVKITMNMQNGLVCFKMCYEIL